VRYRLIAVVTTEEVDNQGSARQRKALPDDIPDFWAVQEKDAGKWYTVDTFEDSLDAEQFLQQLIDGEEGEGGNDE
jgi:hypothetical protein